MKTAYSYFLSLGHYPTIEALCVAHGLPLAAARRYVAAATHHGDVLSEVPGLPPLHDQPSPYILMRADGYELGLARRSLGFVSPEDARAAGAECADVLAQDTGRDFVVHVLTIAQETMQ